MKVAQEITVIRLQTLAITILVLGSCFLGNRVWPCAADEKAEPPGAALVPPAETPSEKHDRIPTALEARERAALLHEFVEDTLLAVHHHYYCEDDGMLLPATTMRGVFEKFGQSRGIQLRWLAVDAEPMNVEHTAKDNFERAAVKALKSGEEFYETVSADEYRYAGPIVLTSECLKCHVPNRTSVKDRLAGLVIRMPRTESQKDTAAREGEPAQ